MSDYDTDPFAPFMKEEPSPFPSPREEMTYIELVYGLTDQTINLTSLSIELQLQLDNLSRSLTSVLKNRTAQEWQKVNFMLSGYEIILKKQKDVKRLIELRSELLEVN